MGNHPFAVLDEMGQQPELGGPQTERLATDLHFMGEEVQRQMGIGVAIWDFLRRSCPAQDGADPGQEHPFGHGFDQILVSSQVQPSYHLLIAAQSSKD